MCGIVGIYNFAGEPVDETIIRKMAYLLSHRGPDDEGFWTEGGVGLGHRRLSIIDLSMAGHQPMCNEDESVWIVYNGEVYNYVELREVLEDRGHIFRSHSDTEVIVHSYEEWGERCLEKFNGMFAFAIWDSKRRALFLGRDRLGVKPLYYFTDGRRIVFASEIKALFQAPGAKLSMNPGAVFDYLVYQYALSDDTFFRGVKKLPPGCYLLIRNGTCRFVKYWDLPSEIADIHSERNIEELQHQIRELLTDSIRLRLRSDVDVGCYLSGGIDSSSITCLAASLSDSRLKTFTGKFADGPEYDESDYATLVAAHAGTEHNELNVELTDVTRVLPDIIWYMDEPQAGPGVIPQFFISRLASDHLKVILGGQGGDELFGGYGWYRKAVFALLLRRPGLAATIFQHLPASRFLWHYVRNEGILRGVEGIFRFGLRAEPRSVYGKVRSIMDGDDLMSLIRAEITRDAGVLPQERYVSAFEGCRSDNIFSHFLKFDIKYYLQALLHVEDRASMAVSLESRLPFLDYRLVELAYRVPADLKIGRGNSKYLLREAVKDSIPKKIYERKDKKGFPTPIGPWFQENDSELVHTYLLGKESAAGNVFNLDHVMRIWRAAQSGSGTAAERLWRCLAISVWYDIYVRKYSQIAGERLDNRPSLNAGPKKGPTPRVRVQP